MTEPECPICGWRMSFFYGCQWDYERWLCWNLSCAGEIELYTTTEPDEVEGGGS